MEKVLVVGCSFSNGSYETRVPSGWGELPRDERVSPIGWYDHLDCFVDRNIDVYSMPGLGWLSYAHLIRNLADGGKLSEYDTLIIQETFEPRVHLLGELFMHGFKESDAVERKTKVKHLSYQHPPNATVMTCNAHDGVVFYKTQAANNRDAYALPSIIAKKVTADLHGSGHVQSLLLGSQMLVQKIAEAAGIQLLVISFADPSMRCVDGATTGPIRLIDNVYSNICLPSRDQYLTDPSREYESYSGHLTENGNAMLGNRFSYLIKKLMRS